MADDTELPYGGFSLRLGDRDPGPTGPAIYGGQPRPGVTAAHVCRLQTDLATLRFLGLDPTGVFDIRTEWAVRELETYAGLHCAAREDNQAKAADYWNHYVTEALSPEGRLPTTAIDGVVTAETARCIQVWLARGWRCPVLINCFKVSGGHRTDTCLAANLWAHDDHTEKEGRAMFVRDWTGRPGTDAALWESLGRFSTYDTYCGPGSVAGRDTLPSGAVTPLRLVGVDTAHMSAEQRSTFRVVQGASHPEIHGQFDALNGYDRAFLSVGPCQWTVSPAQQSDGTFDRGELPAFLTWLKQRAPASYDTFVPGVFIVSRGAGADTDDDPVTAWAEDVLLPGEHLVDLAALKYGAFLGLRAYRSVGGTAGVTRLRRLVSGERHRSGTRAYFELDLFRSWHWFYRFVLAGRSDDPYRRAMWPMVRARLRDVLEAPFPAGALPPIADVSTPSCHPPGDGLGGRRSPTIGEVFQSERAAAFLLRWHIKSPASVVKKRQASDRLVAVWRAAMPLPPDPAAYTDADEDRLLGKLRASILAEGKIKEPELAMIEALEVPDLGRLNVDRRPTGGFRLDVDDLFPCPTRYPASTNFDWNDPRHRRLSLATLKQDLEWVGFGSADRDLAHTRIAVREFKLATRAANVALPRFADPPEPLPSAFDAAANAARPSPPWPVDDVVTPAVMRALVRFRRSGWRNPLVVSARRHGTGGTPGPVTRNFLWDRGEVRDGGGASAGDWVYARDMEPALPGLAEGQVPDGNRLPDGLIGIGRAIRDDLGRSTPTALAIPQLAAYWRRPPVEVLPETLPGAAWNTLSPEAQTTFRVLRAASQLEMAGFLDVGAADGSGRLGVLLAGLSNPSRATSDRARLGAFAAFLQRVDPEAFGATFGHFGVVPEAPWGGNGAELFRPESRVYSGTLKWSDASANVPRSHLGGWAWYTRLVLFARAFPGRLGKAMWGLCRTQLRELLRTTIRLADRGTPFRHPTTHAAYTVGEVFTSEEAVALLLAWSMRRPEDVVNTGGIVRVTKSGLGKVLADSRADLPLATVPAEAWTNAEEQKLVNRLVAQLTASGDPDIAAIPALGGWPPPTGGDDPYTLPAAQRTALAVTRGDHHVPGHRYFFPLDVTDLTPPPDGTARRATHPRAGVRRRDRSARSTADEPAPRGAVRLSPAQGIGPGEVRFGVYLVGASEPTGSGRFRAESVAMTLAGPVREDGWEVPLKVPVDVTVARDEEPDGAVRLQTPGGGEASLLPTVGLAPGASIDALTLCLDPSAYLPAGHASDVQAVVEVRNLKRPGSDTPPGQVWLNVTLLGPGVPGHPTWTFPAAIDTTTAATFGRLRVEDGVDGLRAAMQGDGFSLGLPLSGDVGGTLAVALTEGLEIDASFEGATGAARLDLGSPLAQLGLPAGSPVRWRLSKGFHITVPDGGAVDLHLDLFDRFSRNAIVAHAWQAATGVAQSLLRFSSTIAGLPENLRRIGWERGCVALTLELFAAVIGGPAPQVADQELVDLSPAGLGGIGRLSTRFDATGLPAWLDLSGGSPVLSVPLSPRIGPSGGEPMVRASGVFTFLLGAPHGGRLRFEADTLRYSGAADLTTIAETRYRAGLFGLVVPEGLTFCFQLGVGSVSMALVRPVAPPEGPAAPITLSFPEDGGGGDAFVFELSELAIHASGIDLRGAVRAGPVDLGQTSHTGIAGALHVEAPAAPGTGSSEPTVGEVVFRNSRLVGCSLRASATLPFFDDARGVLTIRISEGSRVPMATSTCRTSASAKGFMAAGTLEIQGLPRFHVRSLYLTFEIPHLVFRTCYQGGRWSSRIEMTGTVTAEPPPDGSADDMNELSDLFARKLSVSFEKLDLLQLEFDTVTFRCAPQSFHLFEVVRVEVAGLRIGKERSNGHEVFVLGLLGEAALERLDLLDAQLTFGGITLKVPRVEAGERIVPEVTIETIQAALTPPAGFRAAGSMRHLAGDQRGFAVALSLEADFLPRTRVVGRLGPVTAKDGSEVPGFALAVEVATPSIPLFSTGFFLRSIGLGLGVNDTLSGLESGDQRSGVDRVIALVRQPNGLPDPLLPDSWVPDPPDTGSSTRWTIAGVGGISYGNLAENQDHPVVGRIVVAFDSRLELFIGANLWVFAAPAQVTEARYLARPLARAALMVFPHEPRVSAYAETLPNPMMGESVPEIVKAALTAGGTKLPELSIDATPSAFEAKIGWPKEIRFNYDLGSLFHAEVTAGFRFGIAGGAMTFGLNLGAGLHVELHGGASFDTWAGAASADLSAYLDVSADLAILGALAREGGRVVPYLAGQVHAAAGLDVHASANCRLGGGWSPLQIDFSENRRLASVDLDGEVGFDGGTGPLALGARGRVSVSFTVCGYHLGGSMGFAWQEQRVDDARARIAALTPGAPGVKARPRRSPTGRPAGGPAVWRYRHATSPAPGGRLVRVLLFPAPGHLYHRPDPEPHAGERPRFRLALTPAGQRTFQGFWGSPGGGRIAGAALEWDEDLDTPFLHGVKDGVDAQASLRTVLQALPVEAEPRLVGREICDEWVRRPRVSDASDGTAGVRPPDLFPLRRRRLPHSANDYDGTRLRACKTPPIELPQRETFGLPLSWLFNDLVALLCEEDGASLAERYPLAGRMRLVLTFLVPDEVLSDPVRALIDLGATADAPWLAGEAASLESARGDGEPTYTLVPGHTFPAEGGVGLAWEFECCDPHPVTGEPVAAPTLEDRYRECYQMLVCRYRGGRLDRKRPAMAGAWLQERNKHDQRLGDMARVPYQFIDTDVGGFREGEWIEYTVIAQAPDRELARADIGVLWRTVCPLPSLRHALALHRLSPPADDGAYRDGVFEFAVALTGPEAFDVPRAGRVDPRTALQVRYQIIDAPRTGHYGFGARRPGAALPAAGTEPPDPDFSDLTADDTPALWEQVPDELRVNPPGHPGLDWKDLREGGKLVGLRAVVEERVVRELLKRAGPNRAIEFFVGLLPPQGGDRPITRSPLRVCRHAVLLPGTQAPGGVEPEYFGRGNTVEAIELLLDCPSDEWLTGEVFDSPPFHGDVPDRLLLRWQHPESGFDLGPQPVSGVRLYRVDAHSPLEYPRPSTGDRADIVAPCEMIVDVWPETLYRAYPRHVAVRLTAGDDPASTSYRPLPREPQELWEADPSASTDPFCPCLYRNASDERFWLHPDLIAVAKEVAVAFGTIGFADPWFELTVTEPLRDRGTGTFPPDQDYIARFLTATDRIPAPQEDAFGWVAAEAIGLSCECVWRDASGLAIPTALLCDERVVAALRRALRFGRVMVVRFTAEDGSTCLDTVRLMFAGPPAMWQVWAEDDPGRPYHLDRAFGLLLSGRVDEAEPGVVPVGRRIGPLKETLETWLFDVYTRSRQAAWEAGQLIDMAPADAPAESRPLPRRARVMAPVEPDGSVRVALPIPDQLAHRYLVGAQVVRRYDELWRALLTAASGDPTGGRATVPAAAVHTVHVPRTAPLGGGRQGDPDHGPATLIAPTAGGVEVVVFRHPAEYASTATAANAAYFEFSGQHVALARRIPDGLDVLEPVYQAFARHPPVDGPVDWPAYQAWVRGPNGTEQEGSGPLILLPGDDDPVRRDLIGPLPAARQPVAKADVYVFPALPEYYQYQAVAYCTAGRRRTEATETPFVTPLFKRRAQWPLSSGYDAGSASWDPATRVLALHLPLPHPRQYLDRLLRPLWVGSDLLVQVDAQAGTRLRYGSLPDLYTRLRVFFWDLQPDYREGSTKVMLPLLEIWSPLSPAHPDGGQRWFAARCPILSDVQPNVDRLAQERAGDHAGRLSLAVTLTLGTDARHQDLIRRISRLAAAEPKERWFHVDVERSGVTSPPCPPIDPARAGRSGEGHDCP